MARPGILGPALLIVLAATVVVLTGCGSASPGASPSPSPTTASPTPSPTFQRAAIAPRVVVGNCRQGVDQAQQQTYVYADVRVTNTDTVPLDNYSGMVEFGGTDLGTMPYQFAGFRVDELGPGQSTLVTAETPGYVPTVHLACSLLQ